LRRSAPGLARAAGGALVLAWLGACSGGGPEDPSDRAAVELPDPAEAGLISPQEAAQAAQETIDAANAEDELERLRREIEQG
jgi:hypothetical protein